MAIRILNTMSRQKEEFVPVHVGKVGIYVCGPTVYDFLHIGNYRGVIVFNAVSNWFRFRGFDVTMVYNYTDVDDKIINRANKEGVTASAIADQYISEFEKDFKLLKLTPHTHNPRVTHFMQPIIKTIEALIAAGIAYVKEGEVLYAINKFAGYGKLSGKTIDDLVAGARVEIDAKKENPLDFTLWKPSKPGEPSWDSPWGKGRPGWHIECSAMASELLGDTVDIHGGGIDLIFPHHENEIAQSEGARSKEGAHSHGHPFVKYWMHNNFINFGAHKMSKSLGNVMRGRQFIESYGAEILKYMIMLAQYRSPVDFSQEQIDHAIHGLSRVYSALAGAEKLTEKAVLEKVTAIPSAEYKLTLEKAWKGIEDAMDDDFNTPEVLARIFEVVRAFNTNYRPGAKLSGDVAGRALQLTEFVHRVGSVLALFEEPPSKFLRTIDDMLLAKKNLERAEIDRLIQARNDARGAKDFAKSDELRAKITALGIAVQDTSEGTLWEVAK